MAGEGGERPRGAPSAAVDCRQQRDAVDDRPLCARGRPRRPALLHSPADLRGHPTAPGRVHRARQALREAVRVTGERGRVRETGDRRAAGEGQRAVVVGRVDEHRPGADPGELPGDPSHVRGQPGADEDEVDGDDRELRAAVVEHERLAEHGVVDALREAGPGRPAAVRHPHGGVTSTRATPAVSVLMMCPPRSSAHDELVVGLGAPLEQREPGLLARPSAPGSSFGRDPARVGARIGACELRAVGPENVGAADVRGMAVEPDLIRERGEDRVVSRQDVVQARGPGDPSSSSRWARTSSSSGASRPRPSNVSSPPPAGIVLFACGSRTSSAPLSARMCASSRRTPSAADRRTRQKPMSTTSHSYACRKRLNSSSDACTLRCTPSMPSGPTSAKEL